MGTNFYIAAEPPCPTCGHGGEDLHIGKSSAGWAFLFAPYEDRGLTSLAAWRAYIEASENPIRDEYGMEWELHDFLKLVASKQDGNKEHSRADEEGYRFAKHHEFW